MIKVIEEFPAQCQTGLELTQGLTVTSKISSIVVAGMGGSGVAGDVLKAYMENQKSSILVHVSKDYTLPESVNSETLVFINSYSGNTEETLSSYNEAVKKNAQIIGITSGGELAEKCNRVIKLPPNFQPRAALGFLFFPILGVLNNTGIINVSTDEIKETLKLLEDTEEFRSEGRDIAKQIAERTPLIYATNKFAVAAYRWKCQLNENGKIHAFSNVFSELNHNEIVGYTTSKKEKFVTILLRDALDHPRNIKRMDITKNIISQKADVIEINSKGQSFLARLFSFIYLADYASYFIAMNQRIDPTPVAVIENLKKELRD
tara:strand:+ start:14548 stop:15504 length:957 start_codon:yes stop_codon:yes gene_type:complete